ncbi:intercompartmental signaling factor BofC [Bacillus tianshenii]|nr:intercompartmental signaling factor BofC [Bacillus tianshenii]
MTARISKLQAALLLALGMLFGGVMTFFFLPMIHEVEAQPDTEKAAQPAQSEVVEQIAQPLSVEVTLQRHYMDGEMSEEKVTEIIWSMEDFWSAYADWQLVHQEGGQVIFRKQINDISPLLKANGYVGLDEQGVLTIFSGKPEQQKVIQSFFQIDVGKLESLQHQQLKNGIPIKTKKQYEDVIESFRKYTVNSKPY